MKLKTKCAFFLTVISFTFLIACSSDTKQHGLSFFNDFESLKGWGNIPTLVKGTAKSGDYSVRVDSLQPYSHSFSIDLKDVSSKPLKKVKYSAYCMYKNPMAKSVLVFAVNKLNTPNLYWNGIALQEEIKEVNKWVKIKGEVDLTKGGLNDLNNTVVFYLWNTNKDIAFADDFEIEFIE